MADNDAFADRRRAAEEDYFRKRDRELITKMRQAASADQARRDMIAKTGLTDPELLRELSDLGFTPDTVILLPLVPIVQVAWAEGGITPAERALIFEFARARGIEAGSAAEGLLHDWLATQPRPEVFSRAQRLIRAMLESGGADGLTFSIDDLIEQSEKIAAASGGVFGLRTISAEERRILQQIGSNLKSRGT
jgi:hypothetical protein